jgi:hypothetical protein
MAREPADLYLLEVGAEYDDLSSFDFADVMWQVFDRDKLESITIEAAQKKGNIRMRVLAVKAKDKKEPK